jgi:hypothetical protein
MTKTFYCSFCPNSSDNPKIYIVLALGCKDVAICSTCVSYCAKIIRKEKRDKKLSRIQK